MVACPVFELEPILIAVAAPPKLIVVATVLNKSTDVLVGIMVGFLIVKVPVLAPTVNAVAAPPKLIVVAVAFSKSKVVELQLIADGTVKVPLNGA